MKLAELLEKIKEKLLFGSVSLLCLALVWWTYQSGEIWPIWTLVGLVGLMVVLIVRSCRSFAGEKAVGERKMLESQRIIELAREAFNNNDMEACLNHAHYTIYNLKNVKSKMNLSFMVDAAELMIKAYLLTKEHALAAKYGLEALKWKGEDARILTYLALGFGGLGVDAKSEEYALKAIAHDPSNTLAKESLCMARIGLGKLEETGFLLRQLEDTPQLPGVVEVYLSKRLKGGYFDGLGEELDFWIARFPERPSLIGIKDDFERQQGLIGSIDDPEARE
jgi:hypothetical protein